MDYKKAFLAKIEESSLQGIKMINKLPLNQILQGNNLELLKTIPNIINLQEKDNYER